MNIWKAYESIKACNSCLRKQIQTTYMFNIVFMGLFSHVYTMYANALYNTPSYTHAMKSPPLEHK